ncbi:acyltransferase [Maribacter litopenaei]|uniref:Acyltransferase n=1 Tax=Maribacter litopenaei TaxID=2976127 RepID=A0ABY5YAN4_9FLAO|nr:acyltransferase [Maribacter litopenaei]UWX56108.1 acyltransferase [Maribacter litopenaei]
MNFLHNTYSIILRKLKINLFLFKLRRKKIKLGENVIFKGIPHIQIHDNAELSIADNAVINSENKGYHLSMFGPCKLMLDRPTSKIHIGSNSRIHGSCIHAKKSIVIGDNCLVAANCQIMDSNGHDASFPNVHERIHTSGKAADIVIEDNVWLGTGVVVLPGVTIGYGSIISANSVVHKNIPAMTVAGGNPIQIIKSYAEK